MTQTTPNQINNQENARELNQKIYKISNIFNDYYVIACSTLPELSFINWIRDLIAANVNLKYDPIYLYCKLYSEGLRFYKAAEMTDDARKCDIKLEIDQIKNDSYDGRPWVGFNNDTFNILHYRPNYTAPAPRINHLMRRHYDYSTLNINMPVLPCEIIIYKNNDVNAFKRATNILNTSHLFYDMNRLESFYNSLAPLPQNYDIDAIEKAQQEATENEGINEIESDFEDEEISSDESENETSSEYETTSDEDEDDEDDEDEDDEDEDEENENPININEQLSDNKIYKISNNINNYYVLILTTLNLPQLSHWLDGLVNFNYKFFCPIINFCKKYRGHREIRLLFNNTDYFNNVRLLKYLTTDALTFTDGSTLWNHETDLTIVHTEAAQMRYYSELLPQEILYVNYDEDNTIIIPSQIITYNFNNYEIFNNRHLACHQEDRLRILQGSRQDNTVLQHITTAPIGEPIIFDPENSDAEGVEEYKNAEDGKEEEEEEQEFKEDEEEIENENEGPLIYDENAFNVHHDSDDDDEPALIDDVFNALLHNINNNNGGLHANYYWENTDDSSSDSENESDDEPEEIVYIPELGYCNICFEDNKQLYVMPPCNCQCVNAYTTLCTECGPKLSKCPACRAEY